MKNNYLQNIEKTIKKVYKSLCYLERFFIYLEDLLTI